MSTIRSLQFNLPDRQIEVRHRRSVSLKKLKVRVGPMGVEVISPKETKKEEVFEFLQTHISWLESQVERIERLCDIYRPRPKNEILLRGNSVKISIDEKPTRRGTNRVLENEDGSLHIQRGRQSITPPARTLEFYLRKQLRESLEKPLARYTSKLRAKPNAIYIRSQRTKWGNCSSRANLSFNWRLVMAPEFVLDYLVAHEVLHLKIPDHSSKFWLSLESHCSEMDRARQWLVVNANRLMEDVTVAT